MTTLTAIETFYQTLLLVFFVYYVEVTKWLVFLLDFILFLLLWTFYYFNFFLLYLLLNYLQLLCFGLFLRRQHLFYSLMQIKITNMLSFFPPFHSIENSFDIIMSHLFLIETFNNDQFWFRCSNRDIFNFFESF